MNEKQIKLAFYESNIIFLSNLLEKLKSNKEFKNALDENPLLFLEQTLERFKKTEEECNE